MQVRLTDQLDAEYVDVDHQHMLRGRLLQALAHASAERDQRQRELAATAGRTAALHQDIVRLEQHLDAAQRCESHMLQHGLVCRP